MRTIVLGVLVSLVTAGCYAGVATTGRHTVWVHATPPAPLVEIVPPATSPTQVWVSGYWWWDGSRWLWVRGHWALPPAHGYVWVRSGWTWVDGRYVFVHGRWAPRTSRVRVDYVHPQPRVRVETGVRYRTVRPDRGTVRVRPPRR